MFWSKIYPEILYYAAYNAFLNAGEPPIKEECNSLTLRISMNVSRKKWYQLWTRIFLWLWLLEFQLWLSNSAHVIIPGGSRMLVNTLFLHWDFVS